LFVGNARHLSSYSLTDADPLLPCHASQYLKLMQSILIPQKESMQPIAIPPK